MRWLYKQFICKKTYRYVRSGTTRKSSFSPATTFQFSLRVLTESGDYQYTWNEGRHSITDLHS